jgi:hypothetical protein
MRYPFETWLNFDSCFRQFAKDELHNYFEFSSYLDLENLTKWCQFILYIILNVWWEQWLYKTCTSAPHTHWWVIDHKNSTSYTCCLHIYQIINNNFCHDTNFKTLVSILFFTTHFEKDFSHQKLSFLSYEKVPCTTKIITSGGCSVCDLAKHFSHPSFVIYFFFQPTHKIKTMTTNRWEGCNHNQMNQKTC